MIDNNDGWISVTERRPKDWQEVLLWTGGLLPSAYRLGFWHPTFKSWESVVGSTLPTNAVNFWMPLPSPPRTKD